MGDSRTPGPRPPPDPVRRPPPDPRPRPRPTLTAAWPTLALIGSGGSQSAPDCPARSGPVSAPLWARVHPPRHLPPRTLEGTRPGLRPPRDQRWAGGGPSFPRVVSASLQVSQPRAKGSLEKGKGAKLQTDRRNAGSRRDPGNGKVPEPREFAPDKKATQRGDRREGEMGGTSGGRDP